MFSSLLIKLLLAIIFGAVIGLERESTHSGNSAIGGIRTYALIALTGALSGIFLLNNFVIVGTVIMCGFLILLITNYVIGALKTQDFGITSELSVIITFLIGILLVMDIIPLQIIVAIFIMLTFVLSIKEQTGKLVAGISKPELQSFISYAIIALVILPFLPDINYRLNDLPFLPVLLKSQNIDLGQFSTLDLINPRKIWMIVVLITGIDVFGYLLSKFTGNKKGFILTSFIAGFVSSTSTTQSLAQKSKNAKQINHLVGAAILANVASFLQIFILVGPVNPKWLLYITPSIFLMIISASIIAVYYFKKKETVILDKVEEVKESGKIFSLIPALKFAGLLMFIKIATKICLILFGESGFVISSVIASFAGLDAILVNLAEMADQTISFKFALFTFLLVNATNLLSKTFYSYLQGDRRFSIKFLISAILIISTSSIWLIVG